MLCLACCGCGGGAAPSPTGSVNGKVTLDGEPLSGVTVTFFDDKAAVQATADTGSDGAYTLQHAGAAKIPVGSYKVKVGPKEAPPKPPAAGGTAAPAIDKSLIPEKYQKFDSSGFTANVKEGAATTVDLTLKKS